MNGMDIEAEREKEYSYIQQDKNMETWKQPSLTTKQVGLDFLSS